MGDVFRNTSDDIEVKSENKRTEICGQNKEDYLMIYKTFAKGKWIGKTLIDVLEANFANRTRSYFENAIDVGVITVNNKRVNSSYILRNEDFFKHIIHQHEPKQPKIDILYKDERIWVVNKPPGIPCHPVGPYHFYTVTKTFFGDLNVGCVNRLDMPVSGVLILNVCNQNKIHKSLQNAKKIYVAKVKGHFKQKIVVDRPIGPKEGSRIQIVTESGKPSCTIFEPMFFDGTFSLVKCEPITGRTHQIRVHLQFLGFPILNDILYGNGEELPLPTTNPCVTSVEEMLNTDIINENKSIDFENNNIDKLEMCKFIKNNCKGKNNRTFAIKESHICLHAWKYTFDGNTFIAPLPDWAQKIE
ncbi:RIB2 [Ecytonucleospora hepatopenaei]|uniref:Pseudouridine synthase n=1 Tax=Ecytonucleospora hepatopenaei TaxID=646526 RepID=A0A1W0E9H4_9MICR|nr:RIB2 [Ecytonucleospora hepatopenaei]